MGLGSLLHAGTEGPGGGRALGPCQECVSAAVAAVALSTSESSRGSPAAAETALQGPAQAQCRGLPGPARPREAARPGGPRLWGSQQDAGNVWPVPRVGWGCGGCRGRRSAASARPRVQGTESPPSHARQTRLALPVEASPSLAVAPRPQGAPGPAAAPACPTLAGLVAVGLVWTGPPGLAPWAPHAAGRSPGPVVRVSSVLLGTRPTPCLASLAQPLRVAGRAGALLATHPSSGCSSRFSLSVLV